MLPAGDCYAAGNALKLKASTPLAALDEALGYVVQNTFNKMSYLKHLCQEPSKEIQAILRSNDIGQQTLALATEEGNRQAMDDVRNYVALMSANNRQLVLHDMLEKRYSLRPYGWPDDEVLILVARLIVLGEISLMMDGAIVPPDKAYEAITTPAKRRKIAVIKRKTTDPAALQHARGLGKELFHEMGSDSEDALFTFLQNKLKDWQMAFNGYKPLADTGNYPGKDEIDYALAAIKKLIGCDTSYKFIEQFNSSKGDLQDVADNYNDLEHFYVHQRTAWERLRKAYERFQLNRLELERHPEAGSALKRMNDILTAPDPYKLIKEAESLINTVNSVNARLLSEARSHAAQRIDSHLATIATDIAAAKGDGSLRTACLKPLETLRSRMQAEDSLAHITQIETEARKEFDAAAVRIENFAVKAAEAAAPSNAGPLVSIPALKKKYLVEPSRLVQLPYLETKADVDEFLKRLRAELEQAIDRNERIEIR